MGENALVTIGHARVENTRVSQWVFGLLYGIGRQCVGAF